MSDINEKVEKLNNALTNNKEKQIIEIIINSTRGERKEIREKYDAMNNPSLIEQISRCLDGNFKNLVTKCFLSQAEYDVEELKKAFHAFSIDEDTIYEILISRPHVLIQEVKQLYKKINRQTLEKEINMNIDKNIKNTLLAILNTERNDIQIPDYKECEKKADLLINEEPEKWLNNNEIIDKVFAKCSAEELVLVCRYYKEKTGNHIQNSIGKLSKVQKKFLTSMIYNISAQAEHFAYRLNQSIKGIGTDNALLERILVWRHDLDMNLIKAFYQDTYKVTAKEDIEDDTDGNYRDLLIKLLNYDDED